MTRTGLDSSRLRRLQSVRSVRPNWHTRFFETSKQGTIQVEWVFLCTLGPSPKIDTCIHAYACPGFGSVKRKEGKERGKEIKHSARRQRGYGLGVGEVIDEPWMKAEKRRLDASPSEGAYEERRRLEGWGSRVPCVGSVARVILSRVSVY
jgi:hypothetical protein